MLKTLTIPVSFEPNPVARSMSASNSTAATPLVSRHLIESELVDRQPTESEQMNAPGSPLAERPKAPLSPLMRSPLLLHAAAETLEGFAQSLLAPLASYLTYTSAPAEEPAAPAEHEAGVEEQPEEIAEDFRSTSKYCESTKPVNTREPLPGAVRRTTGCIAGVLRLLPKGLTFEPLDLEKHPKHGLYIPFYNIVGLALSKVDDSCPYVSMDLEDHPDAESALAEHHATDVDTALAIKMRVPGSNVTMHVVLDLHPDNVDYLFSRVMQGMEAALLDKTRRASRTEAEAKETRAELDGLPESVRASLTQGVPLEPDAEEMHDSELLGDPPQMMGPSALIDATSFESLRVHLPVMLRYSDWVLMFTTDTDGISLKELYRQVKAAGPIIIVVKDTNGYVFGAYISHELRLSDRTFYGNGDCFVFNIVPNGRVYPWTGENEYFIKCETGMFHIGAGDGVFALWLDDELHRGSSGTSLTFNNECLASAPQFTCSRLEIWAFA